MNASRTWVSVCVLVGLLAGTASALNIATVPVGNPGNAGELSGHGAGGGGPDRICGAVAYEYRIGTYEVSAGQYCEFLSAVAKTDTYGLYNTSMDTAVYAYGCNIKRSGSSGSYTYSVASDYANRPVNCVSWGDAARFANWMRNGQPTGAQNLSTTEDGSYYLNGATTNAQLLAVTRKPNATWVIPSEDEWYKAAYYDPANPGGAGYWDYATRSNTVPSNVLSASGTNNANYYDAYGTGNGGYTIGSPYYRTEVGAFASSPSAYGTFDQCGNVWEWNEAVFYDSSRGRLGGSFYDIYGYHYLHASNRNYGNPLYEDGSIGFRVVEVPEPGSVLLLLGGGLALARRRFRR